MKFQLCIINTKSLWGRKRLSERNYDEIFDQVYMELVHYSWDSVEKCLEPLSYIEDKKDQIVVTVDLPYVEDRKDISIKVTEDSLEIRAEIKKAIKWERWGTVQKHIEFKSFEKMVKLPSKVDPKKAKATFRRGILDISLPKVKRSFIIKIK